jgi:hypothetical protein
LLSHGRACIHWKIRNFRATNLSSRPERSAVERSAVSFAASHRDSGGLRYFGIKRISWNCANTHLPATRAFFH